MGISSTKSPDNPLTDLEYYMNSTKSPIHEDTLNNKRISVSKTKDITLTVPFKKNKEVE